jgi:hypothetical protein
VAIGIEDEVERDRIHGTLKACLPQVNNAVKIQNFRACAILYDAIRGPWQQWQPTTPIKYLQNRGKLLERIKIILYRFAM